MLKKIILSLEFIAFVAIAIWFVMQPGSVSVDIGGYTYQVELYVAFLVLTAAFFLASLVLKLWHLIVFFPVRMYEYTQKLRPQKGVRALQQGVIAAGLEEYEQARSEVQRFERFLGENGIHKGLLAFIDLQQGKFDSARAICETMKADGDEKTLSWILEARVALLEQKLSMALIPLQQLYQIHDRSPWVIRELLRCALSLRLYDMSLELLKRADRLDILPQAWIKRSRALIHFEQAEAESDLFKKETLLEQAHRLSPDVVKIAAQYAKVLRLIEKPKKARKVLEQTWGYQPHYDLMEEFLALDHETDPKEVVKTAARLISYNELDQESYLIMAQLAIKLSEWGRARAALHEFQEKFDLTPEACYLMARLELGQHGDQTRYREWMEKAVQHQPTRDEDLESVIITLDR